MASHKVPVTITLIHHGTQPPVYLAGSFSKPAWDPQEMDYTKADDGQFHFFKEVLLEPQGSFQYKFRIGLGEWWVLDETAPVVIDDIGNRNNLVIAPRARTDGGPAATTPKGAEESKSAVEDAPIPTLVVEMTDTQPRYGDDFGSHATAGQRDAHDIRAADAKPDYVIVRPDEDSVHQAAEDAAEVADSAALIDREKSPLPMSDEDAGRTGERRLSVTPIQQVADVANEVADVAALIDEDDFDKEEFTKSFSGLDFPGGEDMESGTATPKEDKAPLFAYECVGPYNGEEQEARELLLESMKYDEGEIDPNDPLLEAFPHETMHILSKISSTESRLNADQTRFDGSPISPVVGASGILFYEYVPEDISEPSPAKLDTDRSPVSLGKIEEGDEEEDSPKFITLIGEATTTSKQGQDAEPFASEVRGNSKRENNSIPLPSVGKIELQEVDDKLAGVENNSPRASPKAKSVPPSGSLKGIVPPFPTADSTPSLVTLEAIASPYPDAPAPDECSAPIGNSFVVVGDAASGKPPSPNFTQEHPSRTPSPTECVRSESSNVGGPSVLTQDAAKSKVNEEPESNTPHSNESVEAAPSASKPSAIEDGNHNTNGKLKKRNDASIERPVSSQSVRSAAQGGTKETRSFLSSIWNSIIKSWIGDLISRFFGRQRRQ